MRSDIDAPGLKWRRRADGASVPYWIARTDIAKRGYEPKTVRLHYAADDVEALASRCRILQAEMLEWSKRGAAVARGYDGTLGALIELYQSAEFSPYQAVKWNTRRQYDIDLGKIAKAVGKRRISTITFADVHRWHANFKKPAEEGGPERIRSAHGAMTMLRMVINFGVLAGKVECVPLATILDKARFEAPAPRWQSPTVEQVQAIMAKAHELGAHSIALGQALQFDGLFRQSDVTGQWRPAGDEEGGIRLNARRWGDGLCWHHLDEAGLISIVTSKRGRKVEIDTTLYPLIAAEIARVPAARRIGPMIVDERSGLPYSEKEYGKRWRKIADAVGVPKGVWNRDSRAGGVTEGRAAGAAIEDIAKQAAHADAAITFRVYDRGELEASRRVAEHRTAARNGKGTP